ncbi:zinc finger protein 431-like [Toxorhynchites rutilus septentrionalis]|uniref:zinc finger protein 431-like n=1 Tax=Toxorhynchites rutilus septentrionalis TaxID=329112 RepID=UPI002479A449|nr:zinc finger protein 431-like [Toxorhynchites rutilus septentrionalis]
MEEDLCCRLCLETEVDELISLYCRCDSQNQLVSEMVTDLIRLGSPRENDRLPQFVCGGCLERLDKACTFRKLCINTNRHLRRKLLQRESAADNDEHCRICNVNDLDELISVFCICAGEEEKLVADMMMEITGTIRPSSEDGLSQNICAKCFEQLSETVAFIAMICNSDVKLRKSLASQGVTEKCLITNRDNQEDEDSRAIPERKKRKTISQRDTSRKVDEADPFIYLDAHDVDAEQLRSLFVSIDDAEFDERLRYFGTICCCGKLLEDEEKWKEHIKVDHTAREKAWSNIKCNDCNKRFQYSSGLTQHRENRERKEYYRCKICNILTKERRSLQLHFEFTRFHPILETSEEERLRFDEKIMTIEEPDTRCCGCDEVFPDGASLVEHTKEVHFKENDGIPSFMCMICYGSFSEKRMLTRHQIAYAGRRYYVCLEEGCQFRSDERLIIKKHVDSGLHCNTSMLPEPEPEPEITEFFCCFQMCYETFGTMEELENHCYVHHGEQRAFNSHFSKDSESVCPLCKRHFAKRSVFQAHIQSHTNRKFACATCGTKFATRDTLKKHERSHSRISNAYFCQQCTAVYATQQALSRHVLKVHEKIFTELCNICGKGFVAKHELKLHEANNHMKERPFKCTECPMTFGIKQLLQKHMITHSTERPYKCSFCSNTYRHPSDCKRHEKSVHLNEKPFQCEVCEASFIRDRDLRLHMTKHTKVKLYCCPVADCAFSTNVSKKVNIHYNEKHTKEEEEQSDYN